jgi:CxxC motif-containing protein (DUF1111 family)
MTNKNIMKLISILITILLLQACGGGPDDTSNTNVDVPTQPEQPTPPQTPVNNNNETLSGGDASVNDITADAFSSRSNNITDLNRIGQFTLGNDFFENPWVAGNASTSSRDGLGGLFNNNACQDCHINDGRGHAPDHQENDFASILFRTAKANISSNDEALMQQSLKVNVPDSSVGGQIQHEAVTGVTKEATLAVTYTYEEITFTDGFKVQLRRPNWQFNSLASAQGQDFDDDTVFSARIAPPMIGLGLLALVSEQEIVAREDINDSNNDNISGKANYVWSIAEQQVALGRFGWKAGQPSLLEQTAGAFINDMGLTSRLQQTENCLNHQVDCLATENGNGDSINHYDYEVSDQILNAVTFYSSHLAVPQRRNSSNEQVKLGKALFQQVGCHACHHETYTTQYSAEQPELSEQVIFPYTDLLLHDMGENLADFTLTSNNTNQAAAKNMQYEFLATAREWRTPALWGIGLTKTVDNKAGFLHDGRARTIMEAILWHGGEAQNVKQQVLTFTSQERADLLSFLNDL